MKKDIRYVPTPAPVVEGMLDLAGLTRDDVLYDLGSGDGRLVIASARRGVRSVGIEIDPSLVARSRAEAERAGVAGLAEFRREDFHQAHIGEASVVMLYLLQSVNLALRPKLLRELRPGTRLVSHSFGMGDWECDAEVIVDAKMLFLWRVPTPQQIVVTDAAESSG